MGGGGGGGGGGGQVLVPKISLAQHKNWQNIQSRDLFTNCFVSFTLANKICCKTFDAVTLRTAHPKYVRLQIYRPCAKLSTKLLSPKHY